MEWQPHSLDREASAPLHQQLAQQIRAAIAAGRLLAGDFLPPEPELAATLGVARGTVARAMQDLVLEGALTRRRRRGTEVLPQAEREHARQPAEAAQVSAAYLAAQTERLARIREELEVRLHQLDVLREHLTGELFRLRRQRQWNQTLRQRGARGRAGQSAAQTYFPRRRKKWS